MTEQEAIDRANNWANRLIALQAQSNDIEYYAAVNEMICTLCAERNVEVAIRTIRFLFENLNFQIDFDRMPDAFYKFHELCGPYVRASMEAINLNGTFDGQPFTFLDVAKWMSNSNYTRSE